MSRVSLMIAAFLGSAVLIAGTCVLKPLSALAGSGDCHPNYGSTAYEPAKCTLDQNPWCAPLAGCFAQAITCNGGTWPKVEATRVVASGTCQADMESGASCTLCEVYICADGWAMDAACNEQKCEVQATLNQKC